MSIIVRGQKVEIPGLTTTSWLENPAFRLKMGEDGYRCGERVVRGICLHTTKGIPGGTDHRPQFIKPGVGPDGGEDACARCWTGSTANAGAHLVVDRDGSVACFADLVYEIAYHCGSPNNGYSVGIECYQDADAGIWAATIQSAVVLVSALCDLLGLPKQIHWPYAGGPVPRLDQQGGKDFRGVYGHRDASKHRGPGDPGDFIMQALLDARFEPFNVDENEDLEAWQERQQWLRSAGAKLTVDGIPGPVTLAAAQKYGLALPWRVGG